MSGEEQEALARAPWAVVVSRSKWKEWRKEFRVVFCPHAELEVDGFGYEIVTRCYSMEDAKKIAFHYMQGETDNYMHNRKAPPPSVTTPEQVREIVEELLKETVEA